MLFVGGHFARQFMTPLFASLEVMDFVIITIIFLLFRSGSIIATRQPDGLRRLERKLDALLEHYGIELPSGMSPDVQQLARDPRKKIEAIKLHREDHPGLGLKEAKEAVEEFIRSGK